jgi:hypothetical protein
MTEPTRARLEAALDDLQTYGPDAQYPTSEADPHELRIVQALALAAIADELHEIRWLLWRATRAPGETSPADVDAWRARVKGAGNAD